MHSDAIILHLSEIGLRDPMQHQAVSEAIDIIRAAKGLTNADVPWLPAGEHFVLVAERDTFQPVTYEWDALGIPHPTIPQHPPGGPITWEHYLGEHTTRDAIAKRVESLGERYGRKAIAKLVFVRADL